MSDTVAGKNPSSVAATTVSGPVSYLSRYPFGKPCPSVRYQYAPDGSKNIPCGPSISAGQRPTRMTFSTESPPSGVNSSTATSSSDSAAT